MSESTYGEPWKREGDWIVDSLGHVPFDGFAGMDLDNHIVACVNALAGLDPEAIQRQLEEREELLEALKSIVSTGEKSLSTLPEDAWLGRVLFGMAKAAISKEVDETDRRFGEWCAKVVKDSAESPPVGFPRGDLACPKCYKCDIELRPHLDLAHCLDCTHTWPLHVVAVQEAEGGSDADQTIRAPCGREPAGVTEVLPADQGSNEEGTNAEPTTAT